MIVHRWVSKYKWTLSCRLAIPHQPKFCFDIAAERSEFKRVKICWDLLWLGTLTTTMPFRNGLLAGLSTHSEVLARGFCVFVRLFDVVIEKV